MPISPSTGSTSNCAILPATAKRARLGGAFLRALCAQAGVGFVETSGEEDYVAVDGIITLRNADIRVQVKCSSQLTIQGRSASWPLEARWIDAWKDHLGAVILVLVIVDQLEGEWLIHETDHTKVKAAAFWARVDALDSTATRVDIPKAQRISVDTFEEWKALTHQAIRQKLNGSA